MDNINGAYVENNMLPLLDRFKDLHHVIAQVLKPLVEKAIRGLQWTIKQKLVRLHLVLVSYSTYIP